MCTLLPVQSLNQQYLIRNIGRPASPFQRLQNEGQIQAENCRMQKQNRLNDHFVYKGVVYRLKALIHPHNSPNLESEAFCSINQNTQFAPNDLQGQKTLVSQIIYELLTTYQALNYGPSIVGKVYSGSCQYQISRKISSISWLICCTYGRAFSATHLVSMLRKIRQRFGVWGKS